MLSFDEKKYLSQMEGALGNLDAIESCANELIQNGYENIYLIGSGGTLAMYSPLEYFVKTHSDIEVYLEIAAELIQMDPKRLNSKSLCFFASKSGDTPETVAAAKYCKEKGATNIAFVSKDNTTLVSECKYAFVNDAGDDTFVDSHLFQTLPLFMMIMNQREEVVEYDKFTPQLKKMPQLLVNVRQQYEEIASKFAKSNKDTNYHMLIGSGSLWGNTYGYAMCVLEEMQWIYGESIHAAEFFHGTLEMVEENTSIILLKGEDETRPLMDRAQNFVDSISKKVTKLDSKDYELVGIEEKYRKFLSPFVIFAMLDRISAHLEKERDHSLTIRRYYRKMEY